MYTGTMVWYHRQPHCTFSQASIGFYGWYYYQETPWLVYCLYLCLHSLLWIFVAWAFWERILIVIMRKGFSHFANSIIQEAFDHTFLGSDCFKNVPVNAPCQFIINCLFLKLLRFRSSQPNIIFV